MKKFKIAFIGMLFALIFCLVACVTTPETYQVTFMSDGKEIYVCTVEENGAAALPEDITVTKESTAQFDYVFEGWDASLENITENLTVNAVFREVIRSYTVTFMNGTDKFDEQVVEYGKGAVAPETNPTKEANAEFSYSFSGWDKDFDNVTGDITVNAAFDATVRSYTVTFMNGTDKFDEQVVEYGNGAVAPETNPTKEANAEFSYTFAGWDKDFDNVTGDMTVNAVFDATVRSYTVTFMNGEEVYEVQTVEYGNDAASPNGVPEKAADDDFTYVYAGWDKEFNFIAENTVVNAVFESVPIPTYAVEIFKNKSKFETQQVKADGYATEPEVLTGNEGLLGYYKDAEYTEKFDFASAKITGDVSVYANVAENVISYRKSEGKEEYYGGFLNSGKAIKVNILSEFNGLPVTEIGANLFAGSAIETLEIPSSITSIGAAALSNCTALKNIFLPKSVISIGANVFMRSSAIESVIVEEGNPEFISKDNCLIQVSTQTLILGCKTSIIPGDGSVTVIADSAFQGCTIENVEIPYGVVEIGGQAFRECESMKSITIPDSVVKIGTYAFSRCSALSFIVIPESVQKMSDSIFQACDKNLRIFCEAAEKPSGWYSSWLQYGPAKAYFGNEWSYVDGVPTVNAE